MFVFIGVFFVLFFCFLSLSQWVLKFRGSAGCLNGQIGHRSYGPGLFSSLAVADYFSWSALLLLSLALCALVNAYPSYNDQLPNGHHVIHPCHPNSTWPGVGYLKVMGSGPRNVFGKDFSDAGSVSLKSGALLLVLFGLVAAVMVVWTMMFVVVVVVLVPSLNFHG